MGGLLFDRRHLESRRGFLCGERKAGDEGQNEEATLANDGSQAVSLTLRDRAGKSWVLDSLGTMAPGEEETIQRAGQPMAMNNTGDTIDLLDADGQVLDSVTYSVVAEGEFVISN